MREKEATCLVQLIQQKIQNEMAVLFSFSIFLFLYKNKLMNKNEDIKPQE